MNDKPTTRDGYNGKVLLRVRSTCLHVATKLGELLEDVVIVGGLVPSLLVDQLRLPPGLGSHAGTMDLDLGLALTIFEEERYQALTARLKGAGFSPDTNIAGRRTNQRWRNTAHQPTTIDFLIPQSTSVDQGGTVHHIQSDFAAFITPGLDLAFADRRRVSLSGLTLSGERATRDIWVCGPGAFTVLKALAFRSRGENKDAYDLAYVWQGVGVESVAASLAVTQVNPCTDQALRVIQEDFTEHDSLGPRRAAEFDKYGPDDQVQADIVGLAVRLLNLVQRSSKESSEQVGWDVA